MMLVFRLLLVTLSVFAGTVFAQQKKAEPPFQKQVLADSLEDPWTVIYGPDHHLWITEAKGYRVLRLNISTGVSDTLVDLNEFRDFPRYDTISDSIDGGKPWPQAGLMGMALHPQLLEGKPYVYLAYLYHFEGKDRQGKGRDPLDGGFKFLTKVVRYNYDSTEKKLSKPVTVCDSIPGSNDHNGGRLMIAPILQKHYLFYSVGDLGAGQFENAGRSNHAQDPGIYEGKILRFTTEPLDTFNTNSSWIPVDNPFNDARRNAAWSIGHRNAQGMTKMTIDGKERLYISEHGPFSDDELNIVEKGKNYGHPLVVGYADGNYNGLAAGITKTDSLPGKWNTTYPLIGDEKKNAHDLPRYMEPFKSFYPTSNKILYSLAGQLKKGTGKDPEWSSLAPSGLVAYDSETIPGWKHSLLVTSLKQGVIRRLKLDASGKEVVQEEELFKDAARYRDITVSPDGRSIFIVTDKSGITSGPTEKKPGSPRVHGAVIRYTYKGVNR